MVEDNVFVGNTAAEGGGARFCFFLGPIPEPPVRRNAFIDNEAFIAGGGMAVYDADPVITNCTFDGNSAGASGGGLHAAQCENAPVLLHSVVTNSQSGGGVAVEDALLIVEQCDVWGNVGGDYVNYVPSTENMSADPLFCGPAVRDLTLRDDSPCLPANNRWGTLLGAYGAGGCGTSVEGEQPPGDAPFRLNPPFPNPARGPVTLSYELSDPEAVVDILILSVDGRVVRRLTCAPGTSGAHLIQWDGDDGSGRPVAPGVYLVRGRAAGHTSHIGVVVLGRS